MTAPLITPSPSPTSQASPSSGLSSHPLLLAIVLVLALAGGGLVWYATAWGPWAFSDSVSYVEAARNLAGGNGLVEITAEGDILPFIKQPPLYPLILGLATAVGVNPIAAARGLEVGLFAALILCLGLAGIWYSHKPWISLGLPLVALTSPVLLEDYTGVMSEPVFLTFGFIGLVLLCAYLQRRRPKLLIVSAGMVGLAALTRYAGGAIIVAAILTLWLCAELPLKRRFMNGVCFGLISATPLFLSALVQFIRAGFQAGSQFSPGSLWVALRALREGLYDFVWSWLPFADRLPLQNFPMPSWRVKLIGLILAAFPAVLFFIIFVIQKIRPRRPASAANSADLQMAVLFLLVGAVHTGFMVLVTLFGPWDVRIDPRQLTPIFLYGFAGTFFAIGLISSQPPVKTIVSAGQILLAVAMIASALPKAGALLQDYHANGRGYTGREWANSGLMQAVGQLPAATVIISNDIEAIMFYTGRRAYRLSDIQNNAPAPIDEPFGSQVNDPLQRRFAQDGAALVLFAAANHKFVALYGAETSARLQALVRGLYQDQVYPEGAIYYYRNLKP